jgi:hypothetical protein
MPNRAGHLLLTCEEALVIVNLGTLPLPGVRTSLLKALEQITDPRARRGIRHSIASTLTMVVAAGLSGAGRSFRSVGDFAADLPQDALARLGARFHPVQRRYIAPNEATIRRHVQMIDADQADAAVGGWLAVQVQQTRVAAGHHRGDPAATAARRHRRRPPRLRRPRRWRRPRRPGLHRRRAAVHRDNLRQVTDRGGEYIVTVKGNQPGLERDIAALFPASPADGAFPPSPRHH